MIGEPGLDLADHLGVSRLKYLRDRTLLKQKKRDAVQLRKYVTPRYLKWELDGPLIEYIVEVQNALDLFERAKTDEGRSQDWQMVLERVDAVIAEGERLVGHRIKARAI